MAERSHRTKLTPRFEANCRPVTSRPDDNLDHAKEYTECECAHGDYNDRLPSGNPN